MRTIKSLLLGAATGLVAVAGAQAADLPVKAKAVEYVKICSAYGAGFYYIPGTDICLRVGGFVRADYYHHAPGAFPMITPDVSGTRVEDSHYFRGRGGVILDARQNTAYGTLRAFLNMYVSFDTTSGNALGHDRSFIQFAGFTFGQAQSFFDFYASTGPHANLVNWGGQGTGASGWNVLAYTAQLGNGLSASLAIEDQRKRNIFASTAIATSFAAVTGGAPTSLRAGQMMPAITGNLRVDQAWGSAQVMAAWQELRTLSDNESATILAGSGGVKTSGYAVGGGFTLNNPSAPGSQFGIQAAYAKGAMGYIQTGGATTWGIRSNATTSYGHIVDAVYDPATNTLHKGEGWGVNAGYQHRFNPQWAWTIHGAYTSVDYGAAAAALVGAGATLDFDVWSLGTRLNWTPVAGLNMGIDVLYHEFDSQSLGTGLVRGRTAATNEHWSAMFRVQRDF